jgi:hypothetical protein
MCDSNLHIAVLKITEEKKEHKVKGKRLKAKGKKANHRFYKCSQIKKTINTK